MGTLLLLLASLYGANAIYDTVRDPAMEHKASREAKALRELYPDNELIQNMSDKELTTFLKQNYSAGNKWTGEYIDSKSAEKDLLEALAAYQNIPVFETSIPDRDKVFAEAAADLEADRAAYTEGVNQNINTIQQNYNNYRNSIMSQQNMNRNLMLDNMQSQMRQSQQSAIEAGASAGVRLANNVNILLSNQNSLRQSSIDTANNLSQTLMNQQAQALSQRDRMLDYNANYNQRLHDAQTSRLADAQSAYNYDKQAWQQKVSDATTGLGTNPFASRIEASAVKRNQSYGQRR